MESKIRKTLVNVYSLVLSIFVCFIVGVALSKISDKVDMQALENLMLSGAFKQCRPEKSGNTAIYDFNGFVSCTLYGIYSVNKKTF